MSQNHRDRNWIVGEHKRRNESTFEATELFAEHRALVTQRIVQLSRCPTNRLCLLGAGNCNDIELPQLLDCFQEITLVDLDAHAVCVGVDRQLQSTEMRSRIQIADSMDVSGMLREFEATPIDKEQPLATRLLGTLQARGSLKIFNSPFDCIVSCCILSQMIDSLVFGMSESHPEFVSTVLALRRQHLLLIADSLVQGGRGLVLFDFVSSQTLPQLMQLEPSQVSQTLFAAIQNRNFFTGLNPFAMQSELNSSPVFVELLKDVTLWKPWRWTIGPKAFGVTAISFEKR